MKREPAESNPFHAACNFHMADFEVAGGVGAGTVEFALKDPNDEAITGPVVVEGFLSAGTGSPTALIAASPSSLSASVGVLDAGTNNKWFKVLTNAAGEGAFTVNVAAGTFRVNLRMPDGRIVTSDPIVIT